MQTSAPVKIVFLDDDPVIRIARLILMNQEASPWLTQFFAPEQVDLTRLVQAARGITRRDGIDVSLLDAQQAAYANASVFVFRRAAMARDTMAQNPRLKLIQRLGERTDGIDLAAAEAAGIPVSCVPRRTLNFTAEHVMLLMLALAKRLLLSDRAVREGAFDAAALAPIDGVSYNWPALSGIGGLCGKTLGIVGLGEVGTLVARMARGFDMRILYHKRQRLDAAQERQLGVTYASRERLLREADFVVLQTSSTPDNDDLVDAGFLAAMKPSAFLINASRGRIVDEDALYAALRAGRIAGAGLDVHRVEPRPGGDRFAALPNVVLTPHLAGGSRSGVLDELLVILENCHAALRPGPLRCRVAPQAIGVLP